MNDDATAHIIATIRKNASKQIRVALTDYRDQDLVDIRVYANIAGNGELVAKKGICCLVACIPALIDALEDARAEAIRRGLIARAHREPAPHWGDQ